MWNIYTDSTPQAQREYTCDAWVAFLATGYEELDFHPEDWATILRAQNQGGRILIGNRYLKRKGISEGKSHTFRARMDMHILCMKYDLYAEE